jgi:hypothetical protein
VSAVATPGARVVLAPPVLAFLPAYASLDDPVAEVRGAVLEAVRWLGRDVTVLGDDHARRVAEHLLASTPRSGDVPSYLVMGNGSARRTDASPGPFDERAVAFDDGLAQALRAGDGAALAAVDAGLARELWASVDGLSQLGDLGALGTPRVDYDGAPLGVQYWVMRWVCGS